MLKKIRAAITKRRVQSDRDKLLTGKQWVVADYKGWGRSIQFDRSEGNSHHWHGWTPVKPRVGDEFIAGTSSGLTAAFMVTSVETVRDPDDMWFAQTHRLGSVVTTGENPSV